MIKNRILTVLALVCALGICECYGNLTLNDLVLPKSPAYRVGISEIPENQYIEAEQEKITDDKTPSYNDMADGNSTDVSYSDLSLKRLSKEISQELEYEEKDMVSDLSLLWQGAAMQSDTINFALYKLANPDENKPDKQTVKKVLKTIASMSTLAGTAIANPLLAGTSFISGDVLGIMSQDTKALNYKYTKVNDADMIILIRKVEDLQQNAVNLYYDYMTARKQLDMTTNLLKERKERFETAQKNDAPRELLVITDAYYRTAIDKQRNARSEFLSKRAALEQFVGNETFTQFEQELQERLNNNQKTYSLDKNTQTAYDQTVQNVENYTNNLENNPFIYDSNLDKLEDIQPLNTPKQEVSTPATPEIVETPAKPVKKTREQKKQEKYSTKGLIFTHPERNGQEEIAEPVVSKQETKTERKKKNSKSKKIETSKTQESIEPEIPVKQKTNSMELLPLDEIRVPDLHKNGYSIFEP